jgi:hypothetical protein
VCAVAVLLRQAQVWKLNTKFPVTARQQPQTRESHHWTTSQIRELSADFQPSINNCIDIRIQQTWLTLRVRLVLKKRIRF